MFTNGCVETAQGALGTAAALRPESDDWIVAGPPEIVAAFPEGSVAPTSPVMIVFNETVDPASLTGAFRLVESSTGAPIVLNVAATFAAGRVVILAPVGGLFGTDGLDVGTYDLLVSTDVEIVDVTGQVMLPFTGTLPSLSVAVTPPSAPLLIGTFPLDGSTGISDVTEIVLAFDRPIDAATMTNTSVEVLLGSADPMFDPAPQELPSVLPGFPGDPRVFTWRSVDGAGDPFTLGTAQEVNVTLSSSGDEISSDDTPSSDLPETFFGFVTSPVGRPTGLSILSSPSDGIGPANLTPGDANELLLQVDLTGEEGDVVDLFVFGEEPIEMDPQTIALLRTKTITGVGPIGSVTFDATEADLTSELAPIMARFSDGAVSFGARLRRGSFISPLIVLDVDTSETGIQDPVLDLQGPTLGDFLTSMGGTATFVTDQRNLVLAGDAGEEISFVEVSTAGANNGTQPEPLSTNGNLFLAQAVDLGGIVDDAITFDVVLFDRALNASDPFSSTFIQRGNVGPNAPTPGGTLTVEIYDAQTLEVLSGATVTTHSDDGSTTTFLDSAESDGSGAASLPLAGGADVTVVTVDLDGYDLWTFHGTPSENLAIPLQLSDLIPASSGGRVTLGDPVEVTFLGDGNKVSDSRRGVIGDPFIATDDCSGTALMQTCGFGVFDVQAGQLGVASYLSGDWLIMPASFDVEELLQGFELVAPLPALAAGGSSITLVDVRGVFANDLFGESAVSVLAPGVTVDATVTTGIDLAMLDDAAIAEGEARVSVEALVPGVAGSVPVGVGLSTPSSVVNRWVAGVGVADSVRPGGVFAGLVESPADLYVRAELVDLAGNRSVARELETQIAGVANTLFLTSVPVLSAPIGTTAGASYSVEFDNVISDLQGATSFYRAQLTDVAGRGWTIWTQDPADGPATVRMVVPDLTDTLGTGLASGDINVTLTAIGVRGLDATNFLWSDLEREYTVLSVSKLYTFTQP